MGENSIAIKACTKETPSWSSSIIIIRPPFWSLFLSFPGIESSDCSRKLMIHSRFPPLNSPSRSSYTSYCLSKLIFLRSRNQRDTPLVSYKPFAFALHTANNYRRSEENNTQCCDNNQIDKSCIGREERTQSRRIRKQDNKQQQRVIRQ
jgi:hypothetical protein